jgi:methylglyoxal synthase
VQIAAAVVRKICQKVIFLQDPFTSHAHETDIRLFEQAVLLFERTAMAEGVDVELATNLASAKAILGLS